MVPGMSSIFSRIIAGEIPGEQIYADAQWVAILDIRPSAPGHALVIARTEVTHLAELPAVALAALGPALVAVTAGVKAATGAPAVNVILNDGPAAGQEVPHVHFHVIPRHADDGHRVGILGKQIAKAADLAAMAGRIRAAIA